MPFSSAKMNTARRVSLSCAVQYNDVLTWADMYAESPIEVKKMIVSQLISAVRVSADYKIEIDFKISERQLGLDQEYDLNPVKKAKPKKNRSEPVL